MTVMKCAIKFEENLWRELNVEMDASGQIVFGNEDTANIQVMPIDEYNFVPGFEKVIEIIINYTSQIALGLLVNWLYDKLKQKRIDSIKINCKHYHIDNKDSLERAIMEKNDE